MDVEPAEIRVLGALIEKQRTTPDAYPLTINALRLACNQSTNREPVVDYDEGTVRAAAQRLARRGWARFASGHGSRAPKYRHLLDEALRLGDEEISVLSVLMLRWAPQTISSARRSAWLNSSAFSVTAPWSPRTSICGAPSSSASSRCLRGGT